MVHTEDIKTLFDEIAKIKEQMKKFVNTDEFNLLRSRVDKLEAMCSSLRKAMGDLEKKMKNMNAGGGADLGALDNINDQLAQLRNEFNNHRDETNKRLDALENQMD